MYSAILILWTVAPLMVATIALAICPNKIAAAILLADLLSSQSLTVSLQQTAYTPWAAVGYGCIDYTCAVLMAAVGAWRLCGIFACMVISHVYFAIQLNHLSDADIRQSVGMAYGWCSFFLSMLAGVQLLGGSGGSGRRSKLGSNSAFRRSYHPWCKGLGLLLGRMRG
jgi:hypothetical protein